jgi:hypothetical protein
MYISHKLNYGTLCTMLRAWAHTCGFSNVFWNCALVVILAFSWLYYLTKYDSTTKSFKVRILIACPLLKKKKHFYNLSVSMMSANYSVHKENVLLILELYIYIYISNTSHYLGSYLIIRIRIRIRCSWR